MPTNFPTSLDTTTNLPTTIADATAQATNHPAYHNTEDGALIAIETKMGIGASTPTNGLVLTGGVTPGTSAWTAAGGLTDNTLQYSVATRRIIYVPSTATVTQINTWGSTLSTAGSGMLFFETATYTFATTITIYANVIYELNGSKIVANGTTSDDIMQTQNFAANTGTGTLVTSGNVPYRFQVRNGVLFQPSGVGRNCLSIYGYAFHLENMTLYSQSVGSALWTEYGSTTETFTGAGTLVYGDARMTSNGIFIFDNPSTSAVNPSPSSNDYSVSITGVTNTTNPTITTNHGHFLTAGQTVVISGVGGATGVNGTRTVLAVTGPTTFTQTLAAPGVYTSGGTASYSVSAAWVNLGPHDSVHSSVIMAASSHVAGRRGILCGDNGVGGGSTGNSFSLSHIYNNFDVAMDCADGNILMDDTCQFEGSYKCVVMMRNGGQHTLHGDVYGGQGGVTLLHIASAVNEIDIRVKLFSAGSNAAPPAGFANTYWENWSANASIIDMQINHPYATTLTLGTGQAPTSSRTFINVNDFGGGTVTPGWMGGQVDSTHWFYTATGNCDSTSAAVTASSGTIATLLPAQRIAPAGNITGVILQNGRFGGDVVTVINESAFTVTFAASGTSKVADGTSDVIAANTAASYTWSSGTSLWYRV